MKLQIGQEVFWVHGEHHRVATIVSMQEGMVTLSGITKEYKIKEEVLLNKLNKVYPCSRRAFYK